MKKFAFCLMVLFFTLTAQANSSFRQVARDAFQNDAKVKQAIEQMLGSGQVPLVLGSLVVTQIGRTQDAAPNEDMEVSFRVMQIALSYQAHLQASDLVMALVTVRRTAGVVTAWVQLQD